MLCYIVRKRITNRLLENSFRPFLGGHGKVHKAVGMVLCITQTQQNIIEKHKIRALLKSILKKAQNTHLK